MQMGNACGVLDVQLLASKVRAEDAKLRSVGMGRWMGPGGVDGGEVIKKGWFSCLNIFEMGFGFGKKKMSDDLG